MTAAIEVRVINVVFLSGDKEVYLRNAMGKPKTVMEKVVNAGTGRKTTRMFMNRMEKRENVFISRENINDYRRDRLIR